MADNLNVLDADELLHLAIIASQQDRHEEAITHLKNALIEKPKDARVHFMLGAEHAEIGMYDRAIEDMKQAVTYDDQLYTAHFQLGLLYITSGKVQEAESAWSPIDTLGQDDPLYLFKTGLLHLAKNEFDDCLTNLEKGIKSNQKNQPLNNDIRRIIEEVKTSIGNKNVSESNLKTKENADQNTKERSGHVFLSTYNDEKE